MSNIAFKEVEPGRWAYAIDGQQVGPFHSYLEAVADLRTNSGETGNWLQTYHEKHKHQRNPNAPADCAACGATMSKLTSKELAAFAAKHPRTTVDLDALLAPADAPSDEPVAQVTIDMTATPEAPQDAPVRAKREPREAKATKVCANHADVKAHAKGLCVACYNAARSPKRAKEEVAAA